MARRALLVLDDDDAPPLPGDDPFDLQLQLAQLRYVDDLAGRRDAALPRTTSGSTSSDTLPAWSSCAPIDLTENVPYAYAAIAPPGARLVFTAGACPLDAEGRTVAPGDVVAQAEQVMENLRAALRASGAELHDVVKSTVYVASSERADLVAAWNVVSRHFGEHDAPCTLLGVAVLGYPDQLVEVEAVAAPA